MQNRLILAVAIGLIATAVPGTWYFTSRPSGDELNATLRSLGYLPVTPPSNLLNLGRCTTLIPTLSFSRHFAQSKRKI